MSATAAKDLYLPALLRDAQLVAAVATTTEVCRHATRVHQLAATSAVALGRLVTAAALTGLSQKKPGTTSLQVVCEGRLRQLIAEVTHEGHVRGFVKSKQLSLPQMSEGGPRRRRSIALGIGDGVLAVTREPPGEHYTQSTTHLTSGEIDADVEHFLNTSDQVPTALSCDVLLDAKDQLVRAAGLLVQALPGADERRLDDIRQQLAQGELTALLQERERSAAELLAAALPDAEAIDEQVALSWRCRCSYERVLGALQMLDMRELAEMVDQGRSATVDCDFCSQIYEVPPEEIRRIFDKSGRGLG